MLLLAHAGHWLVQLIYLVPVVVLVGVVLVGRARDRRRGTHEQVRDGEPPAVRTATTRRPGA